MTQLAAPGVDPGALAAALGSMLPVIPLPIGNPAVDGQLAGFEGTLQGWSLREVGATAASVQEKTASTLVGAAISAALTDTAGETTSITGFDVTLGVGAAAAPVVVALTGIANPINYDMEVSTTQASTLSIRFPSPIPGAVITVSVPAAGGGAAENSVTVYGGDTASTAAIVELYSGGTAGGTLLASVEVQPGTTNTQSLLAGILPFQGGLFLHVVAGSVKGTVWVRQTIPS